MTQETTSYILQGGLNLVTPAIRTPAGHVIAGKNYEPDVRGYTRTQGFERYDGRPKPSEASYSLLNFDAGTAAIAEGDTVTGATSSATGEALIDAVITSGSYVGNDAAGYLILTNVTGTFQDDENLQVSAATKSVADGPATNRGADNDTDDTTWIRDAIETLRADIGVVPGSGRIRGVWAYGGNFWAFRDNAGGTAAVMHKATTSGWTAQDLGREIAFTSGGTTEIASQDTITGATSGATAVVERVLVTSGTWAAGDAAGRFILSGQTGTFQAENLDVGGTGNLATIAANSTAITLVAGGRYEFVNHNFFGAASLRRMYGCDGANKAFEWDGSVYVPLVTGMATDTPAHITDHKNHLFLSFAGGSVQHSSITTPYEWNVVTGAGEIGLGQEVTGFLSDTQGLLTIFGRNKVSFLYGNDSSDWNLDVLTDDAGAVEWTSQKIGLGLYMDDIGVRSLNPTDKFGDFQIGTTTKMVEPIFRSKKKASITPTASLRIRSRDQYRLFWSDGTGLTIYFGRKSPEILPFDLGMTVYAACSAEDASGNEVLFFGSDDGYVYQLDSGTSFDGAAIPAFLRLPFNHLGNPTYDTRFHKATLEVDAATGTEIAVIAEFSYADDDVPPLESLAFSVQGGGGFWDEDNWDEFVWSAAVEGLAEVHIDGIGRNISIGVISNAIYEEPHTVHGLTLHYSFRKLRR